jgi:hypothetical protein
MSGHSHTLRPTARFENGRWRAEVVIADRWGGENVFLGGVAASHDAALALARRLVAAASAVEEPTMLKLPPAWK